MVMTGDPVRDRAPSPPPSPPPEKDLLQSPLLLLSKIRESRNVERKMGVAERATNEGK